MCDADGPLVAQPARGAAPDRPARGALRHVTSDRVMAALACARDGQVIALNLPLDSVTIGRPPLEHHVRMQNDMRPISGGRYNVVNDDAVTFPLQSHSHWDALAHWGVMEPGRAGVFHGGAGLDDTGPEFGSKTLGIGTLSGGIVTRGVLFDMVRHLGFAADGMLPEDRNIGRAEVESCMEAHDITLAPGDVAIFHTGFQERLRRLPDLWGTGGAVPGRRAPGLLVETMPIWEAAGTFALVADNPSVEPNPMGEGPLHEAALKQAGIYLGELFALEELAAACHRTGRVEFSFVSMPLNLPRAFGSPANALAIL